MKKLIATSGFPRAGTTLLQNILGQNPLIHPENNSGLVSILAHSHHGYSTDPNAVRNLTKSKLDKSFISYCKGGIESFLTELTSKPIIVDKDRDWVFHYRVFSQVIPDLKVIYLVRDLRSIFSSFEKQYRRDIFKSYNGGEEKNQYITLDTRYSYYLKLNLITSSLSTLTNLIQSNYHKKIYFLRYEDLCNFPEQKLEEIYNYINIDNFSHNFNNIPQITNEIDNMTIFGDHTISNKIHTPQNDWEEILGKDISNDIYTKFKWHFEYFNYKK